MKTIHVINGPNLDLLGSREPDTYGVDTLASLEARVASEAEALGASCVFFQSNVEGELVDALHAAASSDGIILNAAAYTHYSIALRDAIAAIAAPVVEVHISNTAAREDFRNVSVIAAVCKGSITGFGIQSYLLALRALVSE